MPDAVAGQLPDIIKSAFAAAKQFKKGTILKKVIFVVDPEIISVAYKTVEGIVILVLSIITNCYFLLSKFSSFEMTKYQILFYFVYAY